MFRELCLENYVKRTMFRELCLVLFVVINLEINIIKINIITI